MKKAYITTGILLVLFPLKVVAQINLAKAFGFAEAQTTLMLKEIQQTKAKNKSEVLVSPRSLSSSGDLILVQSKDWCSGFFPGELWYLYQYTHNNKWLEAAKSYTGAIEQEQTNSTTHDMGFKIYCSFGNGYKLTKDSHYKEVIITSAKTLAGRFNPVVGCIKSWDNPKWKFPVIIDNLMNLELLFEATRLSGDSSYYKIAVSHANTTMKNHFRMDYSSYHVVDYDPETGTVLHKQTHQGYSDSSAWARGQAWALYGYTMCYRETKNKTYLRQAEKVAGFILNNPNLPMDLIPYWDFNASAIPNEPRDASAAAVIASALYELSTYSAYAQLYHRKADLIIKNLSLYYTAALNTNRGFILLHSTGSKPSNSEVDSPLCYADYYYLEALLREKRHFK